MVHFPFSVTVSTVSLSATHDDLPEHGQHITTTDNARHNLKVADTQGGAGQGGTKKYVTIFSFYSIVLMFATDHSVL